MTTPDIRKIIDEAIALERVTGQLRKQLSERLVTLSEKLVLPESDPITALMVFITGYIESVPSSLTLVTAVSKRLGFHSYAAPFLHIAEDYFLQPPDAIADEQGLMGLLDEAFLAHRLLEEVNDNHMRYLQRPLLPIDMTEANTIVHHLIGDTLAGRLENLVQYTASQLLAKEKAWEQVRNLPGSAKLPETLVSSEQLMWEPHKVRLRLAS
ncbi:MAG: hypothetical protein V7709_14225 [Halioglobus sp.]